MNMHTVPISTADEKDAEIIRLSAEVERLQTNLDGFKSCFRKSEIATVHAERDSLKARVAELEAALGEAIKDLEKLGSDSHPGNEYRNGWMNYANESAAAARPALRGEGK